MHADTSFFSPFDVTGEKRGNDKKDFCAMITISFFSPFWFLAAFYLNFAMA
jgi:hypothetical protein